MLSFISGSEPSAPRRPGHKQRAAREQGDQGLSFSIKIAPKALIYIYIYIIIIITIIIIIIRSLGPKALR